LEDDDLDGISDVEITDLEEDQKGGELPDNQEEVPESNKRDKSVPDDDNEGQSNLPVEEVVDRRAQFAAQRAQESSRNGARAFVKYVYLRFCWSGDMDPSHMHFSSFCAVTRSFFKSMPS